MVGEIFEVVAIDEYGAAWIEKRRHEEDGQSHSHGLALASYEFAVV